jgi:hypothetical protein
MRSSKAILPVGLWCVLAVTLTLLGRALRSAGHVWFWPVHALGMLISAILTMYWCERRMHGSWRAAPASHKRFLMIALVPMTLATAFEIAAWVRLVLALKESP